MYLDMENWQLPNFYQHEFDIIWEEMMRYKKIFKAQFKQSQL